MHYSSTKLNMQFHENIFHPIPSFHMIFFSYIFLDFLLHIIILSIHSYLIKCNFIYILRPQFNTTTVFPNQPQWTSQPIDSDFDLGASSMNTVQSTQAPKVNNHQKNSERMSEDESK